LQTRVDDKVSGRLVLDIDWKIDDSCTEHLSDPKTGSRIEVCKAMAVRTAVLLVKRDDEGTR